MVLFHKKCPQPLWAPQCDFHSTHDVKDGSFICCQATICYIINSLVHSTAMNLSYIVKHFHHTEALFKWHQCLFKVGWSESPFIIWTCHTFLAKRAVYIRPISPKHFFLQSVTNKMKEQKYDSCYVPVHDTK